MPIDPYAGIVPNRSAPSTFRAAFDAFAAWVVAAAPQMNDLAADLNDQVSAAFTTTSASSLLVGTGSKSLTVEAALGYSPGQSVVIARTSAPSTRMIGTVTSYDTATGALVVSASSAEGSGTHTDWSVGLVPAVGGSITGVDDVSSKRFRTPVVALGAMAIDCSLGEAFSKTINSAAGAFSFSNVPTGYFGIVVCIVYSSGSFSWPASVIWPNGVTPVISGSQYLEVYLTTTNQGSTWHGAILKGYASA